MSLSDIFEYNVGDKITFSRGSESISYVILERHYGGFSCVYVGKNVISEEIVALKTLRNDLYGLPEQETFKYESQLWLKLPFHHSIVLAHSVYSKNNKYFLKIDYIPHFGNYSAQLNSVLINYNLKNDLLYNLVGQLLNVLYFIDEVDHGFIHGDLKLSNLYIKPIEWWDLREDTNSPINYLKLLISDFGLSSVKRLGEKTISGLSIGYAAPERLQGIDKGQVSDLFSIGCIIFELFTKKKYQYYDPSKDSIEYNVKHLDSFVNFDTETPSIIKDLLKICLRPKAENRFQSYKETWEFYKERCDKNLINIDALNPKYSENVVIDMIANKKVNVDELIEETKKTGDSVLYFQLIKHHILIKGVNAETFGKASGFTEQATDLNVLKLYKESRLLYLKALEILPNFYRALSGLGVNLFACGEIVNSLKYLIKAIDVFAEDADLKIIDQNTYANTCLNYAQVIAHCSEDYSGHFNEINEDFFKKKKLNLFTYAKTILTECIKINPDTQKLYLGLGVICRSEGNHKEAIESFRKGLLIKSDDQETVNILYNNLLISFSHYGFDLKRLFGAFTMFLHLRNTSLSQAANDIGISERRLSEILNGVQTKLHMDEFLAICSWLEIPIEAFVLYDD